ncbi:Bacterial alpha-L-rhamnosidase [Mumia zhuanghuii]|uniref:alpha-L-rhamnosidase n=2 Tax=Mumia TaxID=1546255 RepID=A0ABW1QPM4_9ACTN|nr:MULTISPECIES: family 78 glycoside hydrolase catalytic domain [Mumia]KAA1420082.1 Bacterial alpha-L-rhamnosidase [Mumia zhuanghuii]
MSRRVVAIAAGLALAATGTGLPAAATAAGPAGKAATASPLRIGDLEVENQPEPLGVDAARPRLSWILTSDARDQAQSAYEVEIATSAAKLGAGKPDVWDSGRVSSATSFGIAHDGPALASATAYHWRVRVWDGAGRATAWSTAARFETGLLEGEDWDGAQWISPASKAAGGSYLRSGVDVAGTITSARLYVAGRGSFERGPDGQGICCEQNFGLARGIYEATLNGKRVGDDRLQAEPTDTRVRALYRTYDVTDLVAGGSNALGLQVGEDSDVLALLRVTTADGRTTTLRTGEGWTSHAGPVVRANRYNGETYDARREVAGWDEPAYDASAWSAATVVAGDIGTLTSAQYEPMRVTRSHEAVAITNPAAGVYVFDFGTNMSGWTRLRAALPDGAKVTIKHGERLSGGRVDNGVIGAAQTSTYTAGGAGDVDWQPRFVYAGFRWVEVAGLTEAPTKQTLVAQEIHNDVARTGSFESSDALLNKLHVANVQTQLNGLHGIPEDTPTREKRGWMADAHIAAEALVNNHDMQAFYEKFVTDMSDAQRPDGQVPDIVPVEPTSGWQNRSDPAWAAATVLIPGYLQRTYGDDRVVASHYDSMARWIAYVETTTSGGLVTRPSQQWGQDWVAVESTDGTLFRSAFFFWVLREMTTMATQTGHDDDAVRFRARAAEVRDAINARYFDDVDATYGPSQFSNAFPLLLGVVPEGREKDVLATLVGQVEAKDGHFTGGLPGIKYIPEALAAYGRSDLVLDVVRNEEYPGWGYMLANGPGTIWEDWRGVSSLNHPMFSSIDAWLYDRVAGLGQTAESTGYETLRVDPELHADLDEAAATIRTPRGDASTRWFHRHGALVQKVTVPVGATAEVRVPKAAVEDVLEGSGRELGYAADRPGVREVEARGKDALVTLGSGSYELVVDRTAGALGRADDALTKVGAEIDRLQRSGELSSAGRLRLRAATTAADASVRVASALRLKGRAAPADEATAVALRLTNLLVAAVAWENRRGSLNDAGYAALRPLVDRVARLLAPEVSRANGVTVTASAAGRLLPGETTTVDVRVENTGRSALSTDGLSFDPPQGWTVKTVDTLPAQIAPKATATARVEVSVAKTQELGPVVVPGTVSYDVKGIEVDHPFTVEAVVEAPVEIGALSVAPRVVTARESATLSLPLRNLSPSRPASIELRAVTVPDGWTLADERVFTVPADGTATATLALTASDGASATGRVVLDAYADGAFVGRVRGEAYLRGPGCSADSSGEACLPAGMDLLYNFEGGLDGWTAGEGTASAESVRSFANGPGGPRLGTGALEATPVAGRAANAWRSVAATPSSPIAVGDATSLLAYVNAYGGGGSVSEVRVRLTGEGAQPYEKTVRITPDRWNKVEVDLRAWAATSVTGVEIAFRGSNAGAWGGRFQVDQVALDRAPQVPDQAANLAAGRPVTARRTLSCCGWSAANLTDGVRESTPASKGYTSDPWSTVPESEEWVTVDLGAARDLGSVWVYPRTEVPGDGRGTSGANFPLDFDLEVSDDGTTWRTVRSLVGQATDGSRPLGYEVEGNGRFVRLRTHTLGRPSPDESGAGYHRLQLAELEVYGP